MCLCVLRIINHSTKYCVNEQSKLADFIFCKFQIQSSSDQSRIDSRLDILLVETDFIAVFCNVSSRKFFSVMLSSILQKFPATFGKLFYCIVMSCLLIYEIFNPLSLVLMFVIKEVWKTSQVPDVFIWLLTDILSIFHAHIKRQ